MGGDVDGCFCCDVSYNLKLGAGVDVLELSDVVIVELVPDVVKNRGQALLADGGQLQTRGSGTEGGGWWKWWPAAVVEGCDKRGGGGGGWGSNAEAEMVCVSLM